MHLRYLVLEPAATEDCQRGHSQWPLLSQLNLVPRRKPQPRGGVPSVTPTSGSEARGRRSLEPLGDICPRAAVPPDEVRPWPEDPKYPRKNWPR